MPVGFVRSSFLSCPALAQPHDHLLALFSPANMLAQTLVFVLLKSTNERLVDLNASPQGLELSAAGNMEAVEHVLGRVLPGVQLIDNWPSDSLAIAVDIKKVF